LRSNWINLKSFNNKVYLKVPLKVGKWVFFFV